MAILKPDGTPYTTRGSLQQFSPTGNTHDLFNRYNREIIEAGGSPVHYYEVFIPTGSIDKVFVESKNKVWSQHPVEFTAIYEPLNPQLAMTIFGPNSIDQPMVFYTNYQSFLDKIGHPPVLGSRLYTPQLKEHWEILDRRTSGYQNWGVVTLEIHCKRFQESLTTGEGRVTQREEP
jgi:hypothetical protein